MVPPSMASDVIASESGAGSTLDTWPAELLVELALYCDGVVLGVAHPVDGVLRGLSGSSASLAGRGLGLVGRFTDGLAGAVLRRRRWPTDPWPRGRWPFLRRVALGALLLGLGGRVDDGLLGMPDLLGGLVLERRRRGAGAVGGATAVGGGLERRGPRVVGLLLLLAERRDCRDCGRGEPDADEPLASGSSRRLATASPVRTAYASLPRSPATYAASLACSRCGAAASRACSAIRPRWPRSQWRWRPRPSAAPCRRRSPGPPPPWVSRPPTASGEALLAPCRSASWITGVAATLAASETLLARVAASLTAGAAATRAASKWSFAPAATSLAWSDAVLSGEL